MDEDKKIIKKKRPRELSPNKQMKLCTPNVFEDSSCELEKDLLSQALPQCSPDYKYFRIDNEHPKYLTGDKVTTRATKKAEALAKDNLLADIQKLAQDPIFLLGPEAFTELNRDKYARLEETKGRIQLHVIANSVAEPVSNEILIWLVTLRNIISHELKWMERSYITRLVFDPRSRNLVIIENRNVIGGVCFRMFPKQNFSEIAFIAVASGKHVQGYGTHIMNHLKDYHIKQNIHYLLTYAADEAFDFFEKQGFNTIITLAESVYSGYINLYKGARLMECSLDPKIVYTEMSEIISRQKKILKRLTEIYENSSSQELLNEKRNNIYVPAISISSQRYFKRYLPWN